MGIHEFLGSCVALNVADLVEQPADLRLAINAILTADAFFGIHFEELRASGKSSQFTGDVAYRDTIAQQSECYAVLRDAAFSIKHGNLDGRKIRTVRRADQTQIYQTTWGDEAVWDEGGSDRWLDQVVIIETMAGDRVRADKLAQEVLLVAQEQLSPSGRAPAKLADIKLLRS